MDCILVIEDEDSVRENILEILELRDYQALEASNGIDGLALAKKNLPDLILCDVMMPGMNGFEVSKNLQKDKQTQKIPLLFLTAKTDIESITEGFNAGAVDYITKPFKIPELISRIRIHLKLKHSEAALIEANAVKDKFFSIIAHDLQAPFVGLIGFSELLLNNFNKLTQEQIHNFHTTIYDSSLQGLELLSNLLEWARSQTGQLHADPKSIRLLDFTKSALIPLKIAAQKKDLTLEIDIDKELKVYADRNMLKSILRNLVSNALKFSNRGQTIEIGAKMVDKEVSITIADHGIGMPPEIKARLLGDSKNVSRPGTENESGNGLGLVLVNEFVYKNKGHLQIESQENKGTAFIISLPVDAA